MQEACINFLKTLREQIIAKFERLENGECFVRKPWNYANGKGGGEIALLRGKVFEKAAVNFSAIHGTVFPGQDGHGPFFATGISLITHMQNPHAPTVHMNLRFIQTAEKSWLGGGYDLTPMGFPYEEDTQHFHKIAKETLHTFGEHLYSEFSQNARSYFYIPHWKKERGVGGIFFDHFNSGNLEADLEMWRQIGFTFPDAILPIYERRVNQSFTIEDKEMQLRLRAHYVEFNLLYDRGTKFGFLSGGNPEAILCSMPPSAKW